MLENENLILENEFVVLESIFHSRKIGIKLHFGTSYICHVCSQVHVDVRMQSQ